MPGFQITSSATKAGGCGWHRFGEQLFNAGGYVADELFVTGRVAGASEARMGLKRSSRFSNRRAT